MTVPTPLRLPGTLLLLMACLLVLLLPMGRDHQVLGLVQGEESFVLFLSDEHTVSGRHVHHGQGHVLQHRHLISGRDGQYDLDLLVSHGDRVGSGDTLARIVYPALEAEQLAMEGELRVLKAQRQVETAGGRVADIRAAEERLAYARARRDERLAILTRSRDLLDRRIISQEEFDEDAARARLDTIRVSLAEAELQSVLSGAHQRVVALMDERIRTLEERIQQGTMRLQALTIQAPFDGQVQSFTIGDTLLSITSTDRKLVMVPLSESLVGRTETIQVVGEEQVWPLGDLNFSPQQVGGELFSVYRVPLDTLWSGQLLGRQIGVRLHQAPQSIFSQLWQEGL